mmetsp:Transcript_12655/g.18460  ORF Transcript_12655/g.18460 Transcript_12655/m.18460 type:complete len:212 (-) Transcript_12655:379-1014(-)
MTGLEDSRSGFPNGRRGKHTERSHQHRSLITQNISKDVSTNDGIELLGPPNKLHGGIVDVHVAEFYISEVLGDDFSYNFFPELRYVEDVGFVNTAEFGSSLACDVSCDAGNAFDLTFGVDHVVESNSFSISDLDTLGLTKVNITCELPNNHNIDSLNNLLFQSRSINQLWQNLGRPKVGKQLHLLPHFQKTALGPQLPRIRIPLVSSDARQ